jgi:Tol biopolymer transport system component
MQGRLRNLSLTGLLLVTVLVINDPGEGTGGEQLSNPQEDASEEASWLTRNHWQFETQFIMQGQYHDGWGTAVRLDPDGTNGLTTGVMEGCPAETPDGLSLFFASSRDGQFDIWVAHRQTHDADWGTPEKLSGPVNLGGYNDFCPTPLADGEFYSG